MKKIFIPTKGPEDWKLLLADPKHWKTGYSAKAVAYCWEEANDFPESVRNVFEKSGIELFQNIKLLFAFPEYKVPLPPVGGHPSQNDIFILAEGNCQLISITVEGKVSEGFGETIAEWRVINGEGKQERLKFLLSKLQLSEEKILHVHYQLLHRTASAIIEAERFGAKNALMLVHSFSNKNEGFDDYRKFLDLFNLKAEIDSLVHAKNVYGIDLYFSWVKGEEKYLKEESLIERKFIEHGTRIQR